MRGVSIVLLVLMGLSVSNDPARTAPSASCKECSDFRNRCMRNYPGPTCKTDYDICMKSCRKKQQ